jgi:hypothetical protein
MEMGATDDPPHLVHDWCAVSKGWLGSSVSEPPVAQRWGLGSASTPATQPHFRKLLERREFTACTGYPARPPQLYRLCRRQWRISSR